MFRLQGLCLRSPCLATACLSHDLPTTSSSYLPIVTCHLQLPFLLPQKCGLGYLSTPFKSSVFRKCCGNYNISCAVLKHVDCGMFCVGSLSWSTWSVLNGPITSNIFGLTARHWSHIPSEVITIVSKREQIQRLRLCQKMAAHVLGGHVRTCGRWLTTSWGGRHGKACSGAIGPWNQMFWWSSQERVMKPCFSL